MSSCSIPVRATIGMIIVGLLLSFGTAPNARAASGDTTADDVLGQPDFATVESSNRPVTAATMYQPWGIAVDPRNGRLFVADNNNNRVLSWPSAPGFTNGQAADLVIGQADFTSRSPNRGLTQPTAGTLNYPTGLAIDAQGSLYVADGSNRRVLRFDDPAATDKVADQVIGQPTFTSNALPAMSASTVGYPAAVAIDANGTLFVSDYTDRRVLAFRNLQTTDTVADAVFGQSSFTSSDMYMFKDPQGVAVDRYGTVYIADSSDNRVVAYSHALDNHSLHPDRVFAALNSYTNGNVAVVGKENIKTPLGIFADAEGNLYVTDPGHHRVLKYDTPATGNSIPDAVIGQPDFTSAAAAVSASGLGSAWDTTVDGAGNLYISDTTNNRVLRYNTPFAFGQTRITGMLPATYAAGDGAFTLTVGGTNFAPGSIVRWNGVDLPTTFVNSGRLEAQVDAARTQAPGSASVTVVSVGALAPAQAFTIYAARPHDAIVDRVLGQPDFSGTSFNSFGRSASSLSGVTGIAIDSTTGRLYATDETNNRVLSWPNSTALANAQPADLALGQATMSDDADQAGVTDHTFYFPNDVAIDTQGNLYVADTYHSRVLVFRSPTTTDQIADLVIGQPSMTQATCNNGGITALSLCEPQHVAVDSLGNLYVSDSNNRVLEYDSPLATDTIADRVFGQASFTTGAVPGATSATSLAGPCGVAIDQAGNVLIADSARVLEYDAPLATDTVADRVFGQPDFTSNTPNNGGISATSIKSPSTVLVDQSDNLFVADPGNNRVVVFAAPLATDGVADVVFNQPDFITTTAREASQTTLRSPSALAMDDRGNLFVGDYRSNRILEFDSPLANPVPQLTSIAPSLVAAGSVEQSLLITGRNFASDAVVLWNNAPRPTTWISSLQVRVQISAADLATAGTAQVQVRNPAPGGGMSGSVEFTIQGESSTATPTPTALPTATPSPTPLPVAAQHVYIPLANR